MTNTIFAIERPKLAGVKITGKIILPEVNNKQQPIVVVEKNKKNAPTTGAKNKNFPVIRPEEKYFKCGGKRYRLI